LKFLAANLFPKIEKKIAKGSIDPYVSFRVNKAALGRVCIAAVALLLLLRFQIRNERMVVWMKRGIIQEERL